MGVSVVCMGGGWCTWLGGGWWGGVGVVGEGGGGWSLRGV